LLVALVEKFHPSCANDVASASRATARSQAVEFCAPSQAAALAKARTKATRRSIAEDSDVAPPDLIAAHRAAGLSLVA
jgi:hypothetical protein